MAVEAERHDIDGLVDALLADAAARRAIITFLTDYGTDDEFVGVCHGVMRGCPDGRSSTSPTASRATTSATAR